VISFTATELAMLQFNRNLGGPQRWSGHCGEKAMSWIESGIGQPVAWSLHQVTLRNSSNVTGTNAQSIVTERINDFSGRNLTSSSWVINLRDFSVVNDTSSDHKDTRSHGVRPYSRSYTSEYTHSSACNDNQDLNVDCVKQKER